MSKQRVTNRSTIEKYRDINHSTVLVPIYSEIMRKLNGNSTMDSNYF